uniref:Uncharacterized protein n=1 Tax=Anguilla anguilla TaxID=7936 RepID=A0A0E9W7Q2_ANGAN
MTKWQPSNNERFVSSITRYGVKASQIFGLPCLNVMWKYLVKFHKGDVPL